MSDFEKVLVTVSRLSNTERAELLCHLRQSGVGLVPTDAVEELRPTYGAALRYMTREEFFELQGKSSIDYEYVNGIIRTVTGPTVAHALVTQNIFRFVDSRLRGGPCQAFLGGGVQLSLTLDDDEIVYKPDLYVSCDRSLWNEQWIANPKFVVEVLSPSTQRIDRREKLMNYSRTPSIEEYVIASQRRAELEIYRRSSNWRPEVVDCSGAVAEFRSLEVAVALAEIYEGVALKEVTDDAYD
jgi:Uma2 family endonuclease